MLNQSNTTLKNQVRWAKLGGSIIARKCGAEDYGLIDEAAEFESQYEIVRDAWLEHNSKVKNHVYLYFGAPEDSVDLPKKLNNPAYQHHLLLPTLTTTPPSLRRYIRVRNARVAEFQKWCPRGVEPEASVRAVALLVKGCRESGNGAGHAFTSIISARRKEIRGLNEAIERCCIEGLATTPSASKFAQGLLTKPRFIPWQPGHVFLLRDIAIDDIETTVEQREGLREVLTILQAYYLESRHAPQGR